jgi:hypothetical protein
MPASDVRFPSPVRRVLLAYRDGQWQIEREVVVPSMTLPKSTPLPEAAERGHQGFWFELVGESGDMLYRRILEHPAESGAEVFSPNGTITRMDEPREDVLVEVLVPALPEPTRLELFASESRPPAGDRLESFHSRPARRVARLDLPPVSGGDHGQR